MAQPPRYGDPKRARGVLVGLCVGLLLAVLWEPEEDGRRRLALKRRLPPLPPLYFEKKEIDAKKCFGNSWKTVSLVDRLTLLKEINADIPAATQTGPRAALVFSPYFQSSEALIPDECDEIDVVVTQSSAGRCILLAPEKTSRFVARRERSVRKNSSFFESFSRVKESKQRMPNDTLRNRARTMAARLLSNLDKVNEKLEPLLKEASADFTDPAYKETIGESSKGSVLVMCINSGNLDLLLNFIASFSKKCPRKNIFGNLVVFAADDGVEHAMKAANVKVFRHPALGDFKAEAARSYGDHQFVEMMWLKTTCVFLVNQLHYDVLFQDADLVWWRNPWPFFAKRPDIDTFWMDDGARTSRFAPHFPNTGFYLLRANARTRYFTNQLLGGYATVLAWQSHQALVSQLLAEVHSLLGMTISILDKEHFPSGKQFHHNRPLFDKIHQQLFTPYCFHMCWTAGKQDKLKFLKQENLWFLPKGDCSDLQFILTPQGTSECITPASFKKEDERSSSKSFLSSIFAAPSLGASSSEDSSNHPPPREDEDFFCGR